MSAPMTGAPAATDVSHVSAEFLRRVGETFAPVKRRTYELMRVRAGYTLLDLGCGPATDTLALAELVGPGGEVAGVDADEEMIRVAAGRAEAAGLSSRVRHVHADAAALPFPDGHFDACRSERVFQHLGRSAAALAELARVTRRGGRIVVADPDTASMAIDTRETEIAWRLVRSMAEIQVNGYSARKLFGMFRAAGLGDVSAEVVPLVFHDYEVLRALLRVKRDEALRHAGLGASDFERLEAGIVDAAAAGTFFACVNVIVVSGEITSS